MAELGCQLITRLGIRFVDPTLLRQALTHRSAGSDHNERLEFLGDAVLELIVSEWLFQHFDDADEGHLTRLRARLVRKETLAEVARSVRLGEALALGGGELKSGGRHRDSILADALEALLGAYYLDSGYVACASFVRRLMQPWFAQLESQPQTKDPKTRLQEWLQSRGESLPSYHVIATRGAAHDQEFEVACRVNVLGKDVKAIGRSRRGAEQQAAALALEQLLVRKGDT